MNLIHKYVTPTILVFGSLVSVWYFICNLQPIEPGLYAFVIFLCVGVFLIAKTFKKDILINIKRSAVDMFGKKYFAIIALGSITFVGIMTRLLFYFKFSYAPISDPVTFFDSAKAIAAGVGQHGNSYVAFQPYLAAYNNLLSVAMRCISNPWLATIALNTLIDVLSSTLLFVFLKKLLKSSTPIPILGYGIWFLSPLNIIFSVLSLPIIVVNFFIILTVLITYLLVAQVAHVKIMKALMLSALLAFIIGIGNCFRPIFSVAIIALAIVFTYMYITSHRSTKFLKLSIICLLMLLSGITAIQNVNLLLVSNQTALPVANNPSGWNMYVGTNWESNGDWVPKNDIELRTVCMDSFPKNYFDECHDKLRKLGFERYRNYGIVGSTSLFIRKLYHQAGQQNFFYNANDSIIGYSNSRIAKIINVYSAIYLLTLFVLSAKYLYCAAGRSIILRSIDPILLFMTLIMIGWFYAFMFVQSAPRYSTILYPVFTLFAVLELHSIYHRKYNDNW